VFLLCGLGNRGSSYSFTRHNVGYLLVDRCSERFGIRLNRKLAGCRVGVGESVVLAKPDTFMNLSGPPVTNLLARMGLRLSSLIVAHDDLDMDFGRIKIKRDGRDGGHKGIRSIIDACGSRDFYRLKVGIGRNPALPAEEYVLSPFTSAETGLLAETIDLAVDAIRIFIDEGEAKAMSLYNRG
jgi:peptidyl-tRNA hydrolase, PTH1 family